MKLTYGPLKTGGKAEWDSIFPPTNIRIKVDANAGDHVNYVLHELLHIVMFETFVGRLDPTLDEVLIVALDQYIYSYVKQSPARFTMWNNVINKKLDEGKRTLPLEEIVKR